MCCVCIVSRTQEKDINKYNTSNSSNRTQTKRNKINKNNRRLFPTTIHDSHKKGNFYENKKTTKEMCSNRNSKQFPMGQVYDHKADNVAAHPVRVHFADILLDSENPPSAQI